MNTRLFAGAAIVAIGLVATTAEAARGDRSGDDARPATRPVSGDVLLLAQSQEGARFNRLEAQVRNLTGQIEELQFRLRQLQEQILTLQGGDQLPSTDQGSESTLRLPSTAPAAVAAQPHPDAISRQIAATSPVGGGALPLDLSALARSDSGDLPPLPNENQASGGLQAAALPSGDPRSDYQQGYNLIVAGNFPAAEGVFRNFLTAYPGDQLAADAQFWIGESLFARGQYREAADEFLAGYKTYPKSAKGPDSLLKLGLSLAGLGERKAACSTYAAVLKQYPNASNALQQRLISEQAVASC